MKNFKKVLALVLVVVMALGLMATANAAFTDAESITKTEAVDVLTALGVIDGFPDGSFKPEGDVTRAQMAKMVAYIMNEGEDIGDLYKNACAFTDSASHWAAGYIAYCANEGIISGKSPTKFDPDGKVTGTEAAKMLLCALGYNADAEGFKGATWASAVLSAAAKANLVGKKYDTEGLNMGEPLNRDFAAQLMLNALKADMVDYANTSTITIGNVVVNNNSRAYKVAVGNGVAEQIYRDGVLQLAEDKFNDLQLTVGASDDFQRLGNQWTYRKASFTGTYPKTADLTYKDVVLGGTLYTDTGKIKVEDYAVTYFTDGAADAVGLGKVNAQLKSGSTEEIGQLGDTLEVYIDTTTDPQNPTLRVVQINYYAGTVAQAWAAKTDANGDVTQDAYIKINPYTAAHNNADPAELENGTTNTKATVATASITAADKDAVVAYTFANNKIQSVEKTTAVTGVQKGKTGVDGAWEDVTVDSTTYKVAKTATTDGELGGYDNQITIYLDPNGNVIYSEATASNDFAYVIAAGETSKYAGGGEFGAILLFPDGTTKDVPTIANYENDAKGHIVSYQIRTNGKYALNIPGANYTLPELAGFLYKTGTVAISDGARTVNANDATIFVVESKDQDDVSTYTTYTGIKAVPNMTGNGAEMFAVAKGTDAASVVYFLNVNENDIDTGSSSTDTVVLFATNADSLRTVANGVQYRTVKAVVNGEVKTLNIDVAVWDNMAKGGITLAQGYKINESGIVTSLTFTQAQYFAVYADFAKDGDGVYTGTYSNGIITLDAQAYSVTSDVPVYVYDSVKKAITVTTIAAYYPAGTTEIVNVGYNRDKINSNEGEEVTYIAVIEHE